ncbi:protein kinase [Bacillus sp. DTU_2020_1000418_1_SI_GHA_SEK_038]|uniref:serine/threonine protein kinase n=1 Tax=Bacillus sp. DTU_2020_1000418_1_SI_GHA_SEK_038 TaxID=3077585 RepID=UPI0028E4824F|nr:protein kinase [Bacillus sp. DTU_2020_1000418_1_SI_GHA_SEK_038]WNS74937.1 protein kinase [Bacillus sp. DTU_2020_1000418_1_SI_GHA_SEK_038]
MHILIEVRTISILRSIRKIYQFFVDIPIKDGTVLKDRYQVLSFIGAGSYGMVYLCRDLKTNENRVIKQLRPSKQRYKKDAEMFENEISVLGKLNHCNMPVLYEAFSSNGQLFYAMRFIDGNNLEDELFISKKTFNEKESLLIIVHLLELVDDLHNKGIYHQDLRTANILLKNKEPFLIDFGLSKQGASMHQQNKQEVILEMRHQDYYDLGDLLLYLLYSTYSSKNKKALPWTEELSLKTETVHLLKKLLGIHEPYTSTSEISTDLYAAIKAQEKG